MLLSDRFQLVIGISQESLLISMLHRPILFTSDKTELNTNLENDLLPRSFMDACTSVEKTFACCSSFPCN